MTVGNFKDHFSTGSEAYAAYRPTYPATLVHELAQVSPSHKLALDCGCGTGQLSVLLAERFDLWLRQTRVPHKSKKPSRTTGCNIARR